MKKLFPVLLAALCLILIVCAACGGNKTEANVSVSATMEPSPTPSPTPTATPEPTVTPEATATPEPTATPEATDAAQSGTSTNSNSNSNANSNANTQTEEADDIDPRTVAQGLVGQSVDALFSAIGQPGSSSYVASCLVIGGEDGTLYYSGFEVDTVRYGDGTEVILGVW